MTQVFLILLAYVLGSVPFGLLVARHGCRIDPRESGSGNTGATNVARLCGTRWGVLVLLLDALKGLVPVLLAIWWTDSMTVAGYVGLAAICGHIFSCFMQFRGGKAVATTLGVFLGLAPVLMLVASALTVAVIAFSGYVSLGSLTLAVALPVLLLVSGKFSLLPMGIVIMALIFWKHGDNIKRLAAGTENPWRRSKADGEGTDAAEANQECSDDGDSQ